jgi:hypothetical protein
MHWQIACSKSTNKRAKRLDCIYNRIIYRHIDGHAYYHTRIGEYKGLMASDVEGYNDWEPDSPLPDEGR